jgi:hypothetical protein
VERRGGATAAEVGPETCEDRPRAEAAETDAVPLDLIDEPDPRRPVAARQTR